MFYVYIYIYYAYSYAYIYIYIYIYILFTQRAEDVLIDTLATLKSATKARAEATRCLTWSVHYDLYACCY